LAGVAFLPALAFLGVTGARRGAAGAFLLPFGLAAVVVASVVAVSSTFFAIIFFLLCGGDFRVTTWIALVGWKCKLILPTGKGDGSAMTNRKCQ
jgi:hypothetical protein